MVMAGTTRPRRCRASAWSCSPGSRPSCCCRGRRPAGSGSARTRRGGSGRPRSAAGGAAGWFVAGALNWGLAWFFRGFNKAFDIVIAVYGKCVAGVLRVSLIALLVYGGLLGTTGWMFKIVPGGFVPQQDKGYFVVYVQLPQGAALTRHAAVAKM